MGGPTPGSPPHPPTAAVPPVTSDSGLATHSLCQFRRCTCTLLSSMSSASRSMVGHHAACCTGAGSTRSSRGVNAGHMAACSPRQPGIFKVCGTRSALGAGHPALDVCARPADDLAVPEFESHPCPCRLLARHRPGNFARDLPGSCRSGLSHCLHLHTCTKLPNPLPDQRLRVNGAPTVQRSVLSSARPPRGAEVVGTGAWRSRLPRRPCAAHRMCCSAAARVCSCPASASCRACSASSAQASSSVSGCEG